MKLKRRKNKNIIIKKYNYGLGILKAILAFYVVRTHCFNYSTLKNKILRYLIRERKSHVPSFFIMSFYFMHKDLLSSNIKIYLKRIERLLIPYILWPIIILLLNNYILYKYIKLQKYPLNILKSQYLICFGIMRIFWFHWTLIILTTIFFFIICQYKNKSLFLIQIFGCFAYYMQYSGYNSKFSDYLKPENRLTIGLFFVSAPFASTGFTLASFKILDIIPNYKIQTLFFCLFIFCSLDKYSIIEKIKAENIYAGLLYNVRAICLIFIFSSFPSNKMTNKNLEKLIKYITNYTAGVYFLHQKIYTYCKHFIIPIKNGTLFGICIIYLICYLICFIGTLIFGKTKLKHLFS